MLITLYSFGLSILLIFICVLLFKHLGWLDKPHLFGYQRAPIPYGLGIIFFLVFLFLSLFFLDISAKVIVLLVAGGVLTCVSFADDRVGLPAMPRLLVQMLCALALVLSGVFVPAISNPFGDPIVLDSISWTLALGPWNLIIFPIADLLAIIWIVFVINAMNWLDGSPGIVSGISTIACAVIYFLATMNDLHVIDQSNLSAMALILAGTCLAFLFFDFPRPKILMGDSGTMFLGFMIAIMAIFSGGKLATAFIVLAIPILDAGWTIVRRIIKRQSPFRGDFQHFHHELMKAGLSEKQVNIFYYLISLGFGFTALYLESFGKFIAIIFLFSLMLFIRLYLANGLLRNNS